MILAPIRLHLCKANCLTRKDQMNRPKPNLVIVHDESYANWNFSDTHPTRGRRFDNGLKAIETLLADDASINKLRPRKISRNTLSTIHTSRYIRSVIDDGRCAEWSGSRPELAELAQLFAGGTLVALNELLNGTATLAVHLPGAKHHAQADHSSGFCVFADFAIAANLLTNLNLKVAIFDFDAHHGDGTEALCRNNPNILTYSIHQRGIFPGTGERTRADEAKFAFNFPIDHAEGDGQLLAATYDFIVKAKEFGADYIFIAAGADGHRDDRLSSIEFTEQGAFHAMRSIRQTFCGTPILVGGAGGYEPDTSTPAMWAYSVAGLVEGINLSDVDTRHLKAGRHYVA